MFDLLFIEMHIIPIHVHPILERMVYMKDEKKNNALKPTGDYDDNNIPREDMPQEIIPDEVPRKDGPGGEEGMYK